MKNNAQKELTSHHNDLLEIVTRTGEELFRLLGAHGRSCGRELVRRGLLRFGLDELERVVLVPIK